MEGISVLEFFDYRGEDIANVAAILFGVTSGLLTLVGLTAIFISINTQHTIDRSREYLWDIHKELLPYQEINWTRDLMNNHYKALWSYHETIQRNGSLKSIVYLTAWVVMFVAVAWLLFALYYMPILPIFDRYFILIITIISIVIMFFFLLAIFQLINVKKLGRLPRVSEILNVSNPNYHSLALVAVFIEFFVQKKDGKYYFGIRFPLLSFNRFSGVCHIRVNGKEYLNLIGLFKIEDIGTEDIVSQDKKWGGLYSSRMLSISRSVTIQEVPIEQSVEKYQYSFFFQTLRMDDDKVIVSFPSITMVELQGLEDGDFIARSPQLIYPSIGSSKEFQVGESTEGKISKSLTQHAVNQLVNWKTFDHEEYFKRNTFENITHKNK